MDRGLRSIWTAGVVLGSLIHAPVVWSNGGAVWVVDDDGGEGVDFTTIQEAVEEAEPGDTVLVKSGLYLSFDVIGKAIAVTAEVDASVLVNQTIRVEQIPAGETVLLRGLDVQGSSISNALEARDVLGRLWVEDCTLLAGTLGAFETDGHGGLVERCSSVVFSRCVVTAARGFFESGGDALRITDSTVYLGQSTCQGGPGAEAGFGGNGGAGGCGAMISNSVLQVSGCTLEGGDGGDVNFPAPFCGSAGNGGFGIAASGADSQVFMRDSTLSSGVGGESTPGCGKSLDGEMVQLLAGAGYARSDDPSHPLIAQSPARAGEWAELAIEGEPGDLAILLVSEMPGEQQLLIPQLQGVLLPPQPAFPVLAGTVPASGSLEHAEPIPAHVVPGTGARALYVQSVLVGTTSAHFGEPTALVLLGALL